MKIALFYRVWFDSGERFIEAAKELGIELEPINYHDLILRQAEDNFEIYYRGRPLTQFAVLYFRSVGAATEWANLLIMYAKAKKIPFVDEYLGVWGPSRRLKSISGVILAQQKIAYPRTSLASGKDQLLEEAKNFSFPFVLKITKGGRHGIGTLLVPDQATLERVIGGRIERSSFLLQEYIENGGDYRLFLVGYRVLGGFKRQKKEERLQLNRSLGPSKALAQIPGAVKAVAEKAARVLRVEIAAIDMVIAKKTGKPVIIEVNEAPQFLVFEKRTGIDVAKKILEYLIKKAKASK